ncbi:MAG: hypothetical protein IIA83_00615 [Thaumarchaeota archaeon]|nr:hypothetical protein [Nitrososphaerota archaeon]
MSDLLLRFSLSLKDHDITFGTDGLIFHRWLPNGQDNAIDLPTKFPNTELKIWFNRCGYTEKNKIVFDRSRQEVDPEIMNINGILSSGPLHGLLQIKDIQQKDESALRKNEQNDPDYIDLGKRIIKILNEPLFEFLNLLRLNYGQFWIKQIQKWNSKTMTVGNYLSQFFMDFSLDDGNNWTRFDPENVSIEITSILGGDFEKYFTENDWNQLSNDVKKHNEFSLATIILMEANKFLDQDNLKLAFVDGVSALDIAFTEFFRKKYSSDDEISKQVNTFLELSLLTKVIGITSLLDNMAQAEIERILSAIRVRNKVAHESHDPVDDEIPSLRTLLRFTAKLLDNPDFRFLTPNIGNAIMPPEKWEEEYQKFSPIKTD